jgi:hypothetical protein
MPVKEFKGTLDKPKVKEFTGKLDPDETALYGRKLPEARALPDPGPMDNRLAPPRGAPPGRFPPAPYGSDSVEGAGRPRGVIGMFTDEMPGFQMPNPQGNPEHRKYIMATVGAMAPPGLTLGRIAAQSALGGAGYAIGSLSEQTRGEKTLADVDPLSIAAESGGFAAGTAAGGLLFKGLGAIANKIFVSAPEEQALKFATEKGAPYLDPRAQIGRSGFAGDLALRGKAKQAVTEINRAMADVSKGVRSLEMADDALDSAATAARKEFNALFSEGKQGISAPLKNVRSLYGDDFIVEPRNLDPALDAAEEYLRTNQGTTSGKVYKRIKNLIENKAERKPFDLQNLDDLYGDFLNDWNTKANRGTRKAIDMIHDAIVKDIDAVTNVPGYSQFAEDFARSRVVREEFLALKKKYPEIGKLLNIPENQTRNWTNQLFNSSGKALEEMRRVAPEMFDDLANSYLARNMHSRTKDTIYGKVLDGKDFLDWVNAEKATLQKVFGDERFKAIQGLAKYAESVGKTVDKMKPIQPSEIAERIGVSGAAGYFASPGVVVGNEAASFVLAKGLTNPESWLFSLATKGIPKGASATLGAVPKIGGGVAGAEMMP